MKGMSSPPVVGVVGLGFMGSALSGNLLRASFAVSGYDIDRTRMEAFERIGGKAAGSPGDVAERSDIVLMLLPSAAAFEDVIWGRDGILSRRSSRPIILECSTLPIDLKKRALEALRETGISFLDAPLSGGVRAAEKDVVVYGSGDRDAFEACIPAIDAFARGYYYLGEFGNGSKMKYIANLLVAIHNVSAAEALVFGKRAGLDLELVHKVIGDSSGRSRMLEIRGLKMAKGTFDEATMKLGVFKKDLEIIQQYASEIASPTPLFSCSKRLYEDALAQGRENQDTSSVFAVLDGKRE